MFELRKFALFAGKSMNSIEALTSFDSSLIDAGIGYYNLVKVSSIRPPFFVQDNIIDVSQGEVLFAAYVSLTEKGAGCISSAVGIGIPEDESNIGVIMKYSCHDTKVVSEEKVHEMVCIGMNARNISLREILISSAEVELTQDGYSTAIAGVALW